MRGARAVSGEQWNEVYDVLLAELTRQIGDSGEDLDTIAGYAECLTDAVVSYFSVRPLEARKK